MRKYFISMALIVGILSLAIAILPPHSVFTMANYFFAGFFIGAASSMAANKLFD